MTFKTYKLVSRKTVVLVSTITLIITIAALFLLGLSINKTNEANNRFNSTKNFQQKHKALETELYRIDQHQNALHRLVEKTEITKLAETFETLTQLNQANGLFQNHWFVILDSESRPISRSKIKESSVVVDSILNLKSLNNDPIIYKANDSLYWAFTNTYTYSNLNTIHYGFTLNLQKAHDYLSTIDVITPNYAYIFNKQGLCLFHPEIDMIGKNVYEFSNITPKDTIQAGNTKNPPIVLSEYLNIETYRFIDHFRSDSFDGYISINFPKVNLDENIQPIKTITYWIFLITISLIICIFYLFNRANKKAYAEKELLAVENEKFNKEKALIQLQQLKDQINPHFLFNSLNSLYMLVDINPEEAKQFTLHLSKIYRYLIHPPSENLIRLEQELDFIKEYIKLQQVRFRQELHFEIDNFTSDDLLKFIPFLALQIAVENALKHNVATKEFPLIIKITKVDDTILVINNLQKKQSSEQPSNFGHEYLRKIYAFYEQKHFEIEESQQYYICKLPLIEHL